MLEVVFRKNCWTKCLEAMQTHPRRASAYSSAESWWSSWMVMFSIWGKQARQLSLSLLNLPRPIRAPGFEGFSRELAWLLRFCTVKRAIAWELMLYLPCYAVPPPLACFAFPSLNLAHFCCLFRDVSCKYGILIFILFLMDFATDDFQFDIVWESCSFLFR